MKNEEISHSKTDLMVVDRDKENSAEILDEDPFPKKRHFQRKYKIQEVIKVRQILLIQVTKEERGNKESSFNNLSFYSRKVLRFNAQHF